MALTFMFMIRVFSIKKRHSQFEDVPPKRSSTFRKWFIDKKLSFHFGENKTKCNLFP